MKKSTKKLRTLGDLEMKQAVAGNDPSLPKPEEPSFRPAQW
jgi:hypothetical protein